MFQNLWKIYWRLCTFQVGPEVVPSHLIWIFFLMLCNLLASAWIVSAFSEQVDFFSHFFTRAILLVFYVLQTWIIFYFKGYRDRLSVVFSALMGKEMIFMFLIFIVLMVQEVFGANSVSDGAQMSGSSALMGFVLLLLYAWNLSVEGFIFSKALSVGFFLGLSLALALFMVNEQLESSFAKLFM